MRLVTAPPLRIPAIAALITLALAAPASAQNYPFGSHPMAYAAGSITPNHLSQALLDQSVRDFYDLWKTQYLAQTCGAGRYVVVAKTTAGNLTVSEAHGYGMMIAALMAGHDPDARAIFDGMLAYFDEHASTITPNLMAWFQKKSCSSAEGADSASDGDLDIAFALLLADKQWGSCGVIDYAARAQQVLAAIKDGELDGFGKYVRLGDWTAPAEPGFYAATRSSDFMPDHLRAFANASADSVWTNVLDTTYGVFDDVQTNSSPLTGLLPDFIAEPLATPHPAAPNFLEGPNDGAYDYNACRDPWRLGTDYLVSGDARAKTAVQRITTWFRSATADDPHDIQAGYQLDGSISEGSDYRSMAFVAPLAVGAMTDAANQTWLNDLWDLTLATPIDAEGYYENTLKLLSLIVTSGNWWTPTALAGGCAPQSTPLCTNGGYLSNLDVKIGGLISGANRQSLKLKGKFFFPSGVPVTSPYTDGAQILLEDVGSGNATIYQVSRFTTAVPPVSAGACDPSADGWDVKPARVIYRNRSGALDPPSCTPGSGLGFNYLRYKPGTPLDIEVQLKARGATIAAPVGPLRITLVLGSTQTASDAGACAISGAIACTSSATGSTMRCR